jgi:di/tricarboxylate transporter
MTTEALSRDRRSTTTTHREPRTTETKHSSKTSELYVMIAAVVGVLAAAQYTDDLTARWAWILVSAIAIGYMLSRGLAKSGVRETY